MIEGRNERKGELQNEKRKQREIERERKSETN